MKRYFGILSLVVLVGMPVVSFAASDYDFCSAEVTGGGFTNVTQCSNWILNHGSSVNSSTSLGTVITALEEVTLDNSIDLLFAYWPTILVVAVTIGIAFFLIMKAMRAVRGKI